MIDRLTIRLKDQPDDVEGWRMLGWSHFHTQQPRKAAEAYERALALQPASADLMVAYGEALVGAEGGTLTAKATAMFSAALKVEAANPKARYFMGLAKQQAGREREALDEWLSIEVEPASDEPWITELRERIGTLANKLGVDVSLRMKQAKLSPGSTARANRLEPRPSEAFQKIEALPPDQQSAIRGMVEGLAKRLEASPRDEEGWIKLMRSRVVLGEGTIARETLERALAVFVNDAAAQARLQSSAEELGISSN
jgi:cytochrome c-type biogenesis protein CcmH